ncbi:MAG TPA: mannitol dehydrogenase family protein, partial [Sphaerochaeta sp.]|nr:mannitol dehydrogenase family protein [Sphaerochaeta sp.]
TIKAYMADEKLDVADLKIIPLVLAGWIRYLMGVDDAGKAFTPSPDPRLSDVSEHIKGISLGDKGPFSEQLKPILSDKAIFGVDLYANGMASLIETYYAELVASKGAVRKTLEKYLN